MPPEVQQLAPLVAQHCAGVSQHYGRCAVHLVIDVAQQDGMGAADVQQLGSFRVGIFLFGIRQPVGVPSADNVQHLSLGAHAA